MKKCTTYTLGKTVISSEYDEIQDFGMYGTYGNTLKPGCIIRADRTFYEDIPEDNKDDDGYPIYEVPTIRGEYSFFYPADNGEKIGTEEYRKYALQEYQRVRDYNNNRWSYLVLMVETFINTDSGLSDSVFDTIGRVESDGGKDYFNEMIDDLKSSVKDQLIKMGFSDEEINLSVDNSENKKGEMYL